MTPKPTNPQANHSSRYAQHQCSCLPTIGLNSNTLSLGIIVHTCRHGYS